MWSSLSPCSGPLHRSPSLKGADNISFSREEHLMFNTSFRPAYILSALIAGLAAAASAGGLFLNGLYRDNSFVASAWRGNDLVTLVVVVPLLVAGLILSMRGSQRALLVWLGALGYMLYNYVFYMYAAAFNPFFLLYVALVALSLYALIFALRALDIEAVSHSFGGGTPIRWISGVMMAIPLIMGGIE